MDRPIITTVQELAAAVHGIEALGQGALAVRSLQEWTAVAREDRVIEEIAEQESAEQEGGEGVLEGRRG
jgi:hypothetical protein